MKDNVDSHEHCIGGCMLTTPQTTLAKRATKYGLALRHLDQLLRLLEGRCMICLRCHAMVIDTTTRAQDRRPRGILCRFCKQRVAVYEGSYSHEEPFFAGCRVSRRLWSPRGRAVR